MLMGVWFLSSAAANYLAGVLEQLLEGSGIALFSFLAAGAIGAGLLLLALTPLLSRLMRLPAGPSAGAA
jgi:POT family proton-dependent oligopeptide transporter